MNDFTNWNQLILFHEAFFFIMKKVTVNEWIILQTVPGWYLSMKKSEFFYDFFINPTDIHMIKCYYTFFSNFFLEVRVNWQSLSISKNVPSVKQGIIHHSFQFYIAYL